MEEEKLDATPKVVFERDDEVCLFHVLHDGITRGTTFDYYQKYPGMPEEILYLLEVSTRANRPEDEVVAECQELVSERNKELLENFGSKGLECRISIEDLDYGCPDISELKVCEHNTERYEEKQSAVLPEEPHHMPTEQEHDADGGDSLYPR